MCGGVLNGPSGRFSSPIDTTTWKYESESYCVWTIVVDETKRVLLTVEDIDIEIGRNCKYDSLQVNIPWCINP